MPTTSDLFLSGAADLLVRATIVLAATYGIVLAAKPPAALRHAVLLAGLAAAVAIPLVLLGVNGLGLPRLSLAIGAPSSPAVGRANETAIVVAGDNAIKAPQSFVTPAAELATNATQPVPPRTVPAASAASASISNLLSPVPLALAVIWALGGLLKFAGLAASLMKLRPIVERARPVETQPAPALMARAMQRVGLLAPPLLLESPQVVAPVAAGIVGHYIILPPTCMRQLSPIELFSVLCHEGAHLARRDHRVVLFQEAVACLFWFHPLVRLVNCALNQAREEICDNFALSAINRPDYCAVLFRLAGETDQLTLLGATAMLSRRWPLEERIRDILDERRPTVTRLSTSWRLTVAVLTVTCCGLIANPQVVGSAAAAEADDEAKAAQKTDVGTLTDVRDFPESIRSISVSTVDGDVVVKESKDDRLHVDAKVAFESVSPDDKAVAREFADYVKVRIDDAVVKIEEVPLPKGVKATRRLSISIALPRAVPLAVRTGDGDIVIRSSDLNADLATASGDVVVKPKVSGKLKVATAEGDLVVKTNVIKGDVSVNTSEGDILIDVGEVRGKAVVATSEGDVVVEFRDGEEAPVESAAIRTAEGDVRVHFTGQGAKEQLSIISADGDVELVASQRVNANLALMTSGGDLRVDPQADTPKTIESGRARISATSLGSGGAAYSLTTAGGDISVRVEQ